MDICTLDAISLLIVEDDRSTLCLYKNFITRVFPGLHVSTATNTVEALASFRAHWHDIILSDLRMPNSDDGLVIARSICKEKPDAVVYLVTANAGEITEKLGPNLRHLCINGVLGKPVDLQELEHLVNEAVTDIIGRSGLGSFR